MGTVGWMGSMGWSGMDGADGINGTVTDGAARDRMRWDGTPWAVTEYGDTERHQLGRGAAGMGLSTPRHADSPPPHPRSCYWEPRQLYWPPSTSAGTPAPTATPGRVPRAP